MADPLDALSPPPPAASPVPAEPVADALGDARAALRRLLTWVPIRSLARRHRHRMIEHLLALEPADRYLRFGYPASDEQVRRYALGIDFDCDEVLGIFNRRLQLIALAHLAHDCGAARAGRPKMAEFGVSVVGHARGRGLGRRLFDAAALHARNRGIETLFIHALSENLPMLRMASSAGATVERDGAESEAWLRLPPDTVPTHLEQALERQLAEWDFQLKRQAQLIEGLVEGLRPTED
jgi:GNAT superfamily N-acetyltransferase